ncbi:MAG: GNAT family N-acetyltransferase [Kineosporiaceae bacterium]
MDDRRLRAAQGDAWYALGLLHEPYGGGAVEQPGIRLMASGLPYRQWNNGDVDDPALVDVERVRDWYARLGVPWGVRVPVARAVPWTQGRLLFRKRLMGLAVGALRPPGPTPGLTIELAGPRDLDDVLRVDAEAFETSVDEERLWIEPHLGAPGVTTALARIDGEPVGTAYTVLTAGRAGPAAVLSGVGVVTGARRRGVGAAVSSWLLDRAFEAGAGIAHLNPDTEAAARVYARLGFVEVDGFDIFVDV